MEAGCLVSAPAVRLGKAWAKRKFGEAVYQDIRLLGMLKEPETKTQKALVNLEFDNKDYFFKTVDLREEQKHTVGAFKCFDGNLKEVVVEFSDDEEEVEEKNPTLKESQANEPESNEPLSDAEVGGDEEDHSAYNPCPYSHEEAQKEQDKHTSNGFDWGLKSQLVDWSADRPVFVTKSRLDNASTADPLAYVLLYLCPLAFVCVGQ